MTISLPLNPLNPTTSQRKDEGVPAGPENNHNREQNSQLGQFSRLSLTTHATLIKGCAFTPTDTETQCPGDFVYVFCAPHKE